MRKLLVATFIVLLPNLMFGQHAHFITEGEILFEKSVNMYSVLEKAANSNTTAKAAYEAYRKSHPQFLILRSKLFFNKDHSAYIPLESAITNLSYFGQNPMYSQINKIYNSLKLDSIIVQKNVFDEIFLVKDKKIPIKWKLTGETREIAGFDCRRANGLVNDSVYVVAFYTTKIPISGGPESFYGLPGMILGVAVPHHNVTWFAHTLIETKLPSDKFRPELKGKPSTFEELKKVLQKTLEQMGTLNDQQWIGYLL